MRNPESTKTGRLPSSRPRSSARKSVVRDDEQDRHPANPVKAGLCGEAPPGAAMGASGRGAWCYGAPRRARAVGGVLRGATPALLMAAAAPARRAPRIALEQDGVESQCTACHRVVRERSASGNRFR